MTATQYQLSNGVRVVIDEIPHTQSAAVGMYFTVGTRHETKKNNGVAHFLEHMHFRGTKRRNSEQIKNDAGNMGAHLNAQTGHNSTCYHVTGRAEHISKMIDLLADMVCHSKISAQAVERERGAVMSEIMDSYDDPQSNVLKDAQKEAYPDQALGADILGPIENIKTMPRKTLKDFKDQHYHAGNLIVSIAGNVKADEVLRELETALKTLPTNMPSQHEKPRYEGGSSHRKDASGQVYLVLQFNSYARDDERSLSANILGDVLGGDFSSRLFREVRDKRSLVYQIMAANGPDTDAGVFQIFTSGERKNIEAAMPVICNELRKSMKKGFSDEEINRAKEGWKTFYATAGDSMEDRMHRNAENIHYFGRVRPVQERLDELEKKVTPESVRAAAKEIFSGTPSVVSKGPGGWLMKPDEIARRLSL